MRLCHVVALLAVAAPMVAAQNKSKKHNDISAAFAHAHFVYVQAQSGDITKPSLYPEDRDAISDVQDGVRDWNRYSLATSREQADLVFMVRKGRAAGVQGRAGISVGQRPPTPSGQPREPGGLPPDDQGTGVGVATEVGPSDDILLVYITGTDGKLVGPVWKQEMQDGLDAPAVPLLRQLRNAVDQAYPTQPAPHKP